jgi:hypothetical protein
MRLNHFADRTDAEKQAMLAKYLDREPDIPRHLQTIVCPDGKYALNGQCTPCQTVACKTCPDNICT